MKTFFYLACALIAIGPLSADVIKITYPNWPEGIALSHLAEAILEDRMGLEVELTEATPATIFENVYNGQQDVFLIAWLPFTHSEYWEKYGSDYDRLGTVYVSAMTGLAVPSYVNIRSITELPKIADQIDSTIIGLGPEAGMTMLTELVFREYALTDFKQKNGGNDAIVAAIDEAIAAKKPIVFAAWKPDWKFTHYDIKMLNDPNNVFQREGIRKLARPGFKKDHKKATVFLEKFALTEEQLQGLLLAIYKSDEPVEAVVDQWIADNDELVKYWTKKKSWWGN